MQLKYVRDDPDGFAELVLSDDDGVQVIPLTKKDVIALMGSLAPMIPAAMRKG